MKGKSLVKKEKMTYEHFPHEADIGIRGIGNSVEEAFCEAAKALFDVEVDIKTVEPKEEIKITAEASNIEELFVEWLNSLLAEAGINNMVFSEFKVHISNNKLQGVAFGEQLDVQKHKAKEEVKGATYSQLKVEVAASGKHKGKWIAQCIVDV